MLRLFPGFELRVPKEIFVTTCGSRTSGIEPGRDDLSLKIPFFTSAQKTGGYPLMREVSQHLFRCSLVGNVDKMEVAIAPLAQRIDAILAR